MPFHQRETKNNHFDFSEPSIRGILSAFAGIAHTCGIMCVFVLGAFFSWRKVALICFCTPWITALAICFVRIRCQRTRTHSVTHSRAPTNSCQSIEFQIPESPIWLLFNNRPDDAIKALQWLRGWVPSSAIMNEFNTLQTYKIESIVSTVRANRENVKSVTSTTAVRQRIDDFCQRSTLMPFMLLTFMFFISQFCGMFAIRPYIAQILFVYESPVTPIVVTVWLGALGIFANILMMIVIRTFGKRSITLISMAITFISCFALGAYGFITLPPGISSFHVSPTAYSTPPATTTNPLAYIPLICIYVMHFATSFVTSTPNLLLCEVFPFK